MKRFRVRNMKETYQDMGPDLLRPQPNAISKLASIIGKSREEWHIRKNSPKKEEWSKWDGPMRRGEALQKTAAFARTATNGSKLQIGRKVGKNIETKGEILVANVPEKKIGLNPGAQLVADLNRAQFSPTISGFACRRYNFSPTSGWSDHAWRDAVDITGTGESNDKVTNWNVRMAKEGCMGNPDQFIGSINGKVYSFYSPSYSATYGGPSSHLTHLHCSYQQHYGANPGCS